MLATFMTLACCGSRMCRRKLLTSKDVNLRCGDDTPVSVATKQPPKGHPNMTCQFQHRHEKKVCEMCFRMVFFVYFSDNVTNCINNSKFAYH
jgi:hypothetical protein